MDNQKIVLNDSQMARLGEEMEACARRLDELQARLGLSLSPQMENQGAALDTDPIRRLDEEVEACATRLDELNMRFPNLATSVTREAVEHWRSRNQRTLTYEQRESDHAGYDEVYVKGLAIGLLADHPLEDIVTILSSEHDIALTLPQLVDLIERENYLAALRRDVAVLTKNSVSYEQIAKLWTENGRPALGRTGWSAQSVSALVGWQRGP